jgi:hypothetical protein
MASFTHTAIQDCNNPGWHEDFVYDNIGMVYVKDINGSNTDMRFLSKMDQDYYYDWLKGDYLGSGTTFPATKKWGDRYVKSGVYYWWDGTDWIAFDETCYLMLDYFKTESSYLKTGTRIYRTDEDKEYRYSSGGAWVEITATTGDAKRRMQWKNGMTSITATDERSCFYCREIDAADPYNDAYTKFWAVLQVGAVYPDHVDLQVFFSEFRRSQQFWCVMKPADVAAGWKFYWVKITLQSQETIKPNADIVDVLMTLVTDTSAAYTATNWADGLNYRKFYAYMYKGDPADPDVTQYDTMEHYGISTRTSCPEWDPQAMCLAYSTYRYVDGATGSDADTGVDWAHAWATIGKAATTVTAGTLVTVKAGTYNITSAITPANSGTASQPIHYFADGDVIIDAGGNYVDVVEITKAYLIWDGFEIKNATGHGFYLRAGSSYCVLYNNYIHDIYNSSVRRSGIYLASTGGGHNEVVGNKVADIGCGAGAAYCISNYSEWNTIIHNELIADGVNGVTIYNSATYFYSYESINNIGNFYSDATIDDSDNDCIGATTYTKGSWNDPKPIVMKGAAFHKVYSLNWLRSHLANSTSSLNAEQTAAGWTSVISDLFYANLRQLGLVNVPPTGSGATPPNGFVESWCPDTKTRRIAYAKPAPGGVTGIGGCDIRGCAQILDGCDFARIKTINYTPTYNPVSRILDRNANGDIIISGTGIINLTDE